VDEVRNNVKFTEKRGGGLNMRIEMNGMVIEGTVDELREIGVKFPGEEETAQEAKLKVGDYAKIVTEPGDHEFPKGTIVKLVATCDDEYDFKAEYLDGSDYWYVYESDIIRATDEEVAQAKAKVTAPKFEVGDYVVPLPEADDEYGITNTEMKLGKVIYVYNDGDIKVEIIAHEDDRNVGDSYLVNPKYFRKATDEEIRWAKIGRKPGEFKKGDIVRYLGGAPTKKGELVEVYEDTSGTTTKIKWVDDYGVCTERNDDLELVTPVEQRFDIAAEGARQ
jgi:hypothetical protein